MTQHAEPEILSKLAQAALVLAGDTPWATLTLSDLCADADVLLADCAQARLTKAHVAAYLDSDLDQAMLRATSKVDRTQGVRDRLFDALMARFDAMEENRAAWVSILDGEAGDGLARVARHARRARTGAWALESCGVTASNMRGAGRVMGLARILRLTQAAWRDDGPDLAKTMARLDQELRKGEAWVERAQGFADMMSGFAARTQKPHTPQDAAAD
jgi:hypothetical protein